MPANGDIWEIARTPGVPLQTRRVNGNSAIHPTKPAFRANALAVAGP